MISVTKQQAANFLLAHTSLNSDRSYLQVLNDLSCVQVDPINVVARAHELSMYNRAKGFRKDDLDKALYQDHTAFEYWLQLYSIIPIAAFPYLDAIREVPGDRQREASPTWQDDYLREHKREVNLVLDHIKDTGPTSARDLTHLPKGGAVMSWKGESSHTALLEYLWVRGQIQICHRQHNHKFYDLTERVFPKEILEQKVTPAEGYKFVLDSYFKYTGLVRTFSLNRSGRARAAGLREEFKRQLNNGEITQVKIGDSKIKYFVKTDQITLLENPPQKPHTGINFLCPLDPLIIDRELMLDVWDFFYRWEAYTPANKRKYGFYNMPILYNGEIVGQIDLANKSGVKTYISKGNLTQLKHQINSEAKKLQEFSSAKKA